MLRREGLQGAEAGGREIAGDAAHAEAVGAIGRHFDLDDRIVEIAVLDEAHADRRVIGQFDDAVVIGAQAQLAGRAEHAVRGFAANDARFEIEAGAGNVGARRGEHTFHAGARVGCAADHLHDTLAGIDAADPQTVGIRMLLRFRDIADHERLERLGRILDAFDLEAERRQGLGDGGGIGTGVQLGLQPGEGELHRVSPPTTEGTSSGRKP